MEDKLGLIRKYRNDRRKESEEWYKIQSRDRLLANTKKRIETTMVGALNAVEEIFGELWNQGGKPTTEDEKYFDKLREELRIRIFNLGNAQIRAAVNEISQYRVEWLRYQYNIEMRDN